MCVCVCFRIGIKILCDKGLGPPIRKVYSRSENRDNELTDCSVTNELKH